METTRTNDAFRDSTLPLETRVEDLLGRLTLNEKVALMAGSAAFTMHGVERLGVPPVRVTDGPTGVRSNEGEVATVFPVGVAMAATWNPDLTREVAAAIAREALALNNYVVLAPTINIVRTPLWGRNFENYSEDPFLAGTLGAAYIQGLQGEGVGASLKHYAVNNQEVRRMTVSAQVDERTLREIYLAGFEIAVKSANPWTVMASYNRVNGIHATEHDYLLNEILKREWGYDGVVVSDWGAVHSTAPAATGGTDLEMPGPAQWFGDKLLAAVQTGAAPDWRIEDAARRMLRLILRTGVLDGEAPPAGELRTARHRAIAARAAEEAVVLLKNDGDLLPLSPAAIRYFKTGKSWLYRNLPFSVAGVVEGVIALIVPMAIVLIPGLKLIPAVLRWRVKLILFRWYRALQAVERGLHGPANPEAHREWMNRLDHIEATVKSISIPASFADQFYALRGHITYVRERFKEPGPGVVHPK